MNSYFGELQVPLVISTMGIPFVRSLEAAVAYRYEKFNNKDQFGNAATTGIPPKRTSSFNNNGDVRVSLRYAPIQDITLRASFGESFLSPTPFQLFAPIADNFPQLFDPAHQPNLQPSKASCRAGTSTLRPETTESYTAGIVITPRIPSGLHRHGGFLSALHPQRDPAGGRFRGHRPDCERKLPRAESGRAAGSGPLRRAVQHSLPSERSQCADGRLS